ncbi:MAG: UDP-glucose/GDP-mannose dehydrogenase family protein [Acidobacteriia bacterium]|nr:UDP-glucose/GDP-mannose dehydrogenase family protein [Terriglobia bacterium]
MGKTSVEKTRIAVLGMGHVGLPTALGLAELGWEVIGADSNPETIATLKTGKSWFYEPDLEPLLQKHLDSGLFIPTDDVGGAIASATVLFVCVGTPQGDDGKADLTQIESIARMVARNLNGYKLIVEKSTVPAITAQWVKKTIARYARVEPRANGSGNGHGNGNGSAKPGKRTRTTPLQPRFDVASNPEFLQEGRAIENFFKPDRIVIGVESERARELLEAIYRPLKCPIVVTNITTSELIKHAANAFLSTKISFINMVSDICEAVGADVVNVARGIGLDPRIGTGFLSAGIGFGGYCFPKDLRAFMYLGEEHGANCALLKEVEHVNLKRIDIFLKKVRKALWVPQGKTIGVLLPEQPGRVTYCRTAYEAAAGAHALLLLTEWSEFKELDLHRVRDLMEVPVLVDGRNLYDPAEARHAGFEYHSMGRDSVGHHFPVVSTAKPAPRRKQAATLAKVDKTASKLRAVVN